MTDARSESPFAPHTSAETATMLATLDVDSVDELFDVPDTVRFDGDFGITPRSEHAVRTDVQRVLDRNDAVSSFLGRGHYAHYVPSIVDDLASRSEFLTAYTQYQPEVAQGFLQALFEYQSMLVELTGLAVANCSMYDHATALGEASTLARRVRGTSGTRILVPEILCEKRRSVLSNYATGSDLTIETYPMVDANVDTEALANQIDDDVVMVYAESPTIRGTIEENLDAIGDIVASHGALFCLGTDPVALALLEQPASVGVDVVVGDAGSLGLGMAYGMGHGLFVTHEKYLRQVPGRLVGAADDATGRRSFTLTLQTREQHIRRERATSNICTNQAWLALRTAIHLAWLGPDGLFDLAQSAVTRPRELAIRIAEINGVIAPTHDRHHFREFVATTDQPAEAIRTDLADRGYAVHAIDEHHIQICVTELNESAIDDFVVALEDIA